MKKILWFAAFFLFLIHMTSAQATERILSFHSDIKIQVDGSMAVTETIRVTAEGATIKHGIYRDFPTRYRSYSGQNIEVKFKLLSVSLDGRSEEFRVERQDNGVRVYIGSKNASVPFGEHTYALTYTTDRQLGFFKDHDELYWNVTGNGWSFEIDQVSASVDLPLRAKNSILEVNAYTGKMGARGEDFQIGRDDEGRVTFQTIRSLRTQEGLTILVSWKKGCFWEPTGAQKAGYFIKDNFGIVLGGAGLVVLFLFFLFTWNQVGRDPAKGVIIPLFYPPEGFSPAALRYLMRTGFDDKAVACAVIDMAVKGYLVISEAEDGITVLTKTGQGDEKLSAEEKVLAKEFFQSEGVLELKTRNHEAIASGIERMKKALAKNMEKIYFVTNQKYFLIGLLITVVIVVVTAILTANQPAVALFMSVWLSIWTVGVTVLVFSAIQKWQDALKGAGQLVGALGITVFALPFVAGELFGIGLFCWATSVGFVVLLLAAVIMDVVFYHLLKAPTLQGRKVMDQVEGFKMYLSVAEKDSLKMLAAPKETTELFERYLPYALALDVQQVWAEHFSEALSRASQDRSYHPSWYSGSMWTAAGCAGFASGLGSSLSHSISSSSAAPGSSSGGSGGGSSGGGGGGGGGGGW